MFSSFRRTAHCFSRLQYSLVILLPHQRGCRIRFLYLLRPTSWCPGGRGKQDSLKWTLRPYRRNGNSRRQHIVSHWSCSVLCGCALWLLILFCLVCSFSPPFSQWIVFVGSLVLRASRFSSAVSLVYCLLSTHFNSVPMLAGLDRRWDDDAIITDDGFVYVDVCVCVSVSDLDGGRSIWSVCSMDALCH